MPARKQGAVFRRWRKNLPADIAAIKPEEREKLPKDIKDRWQEEKWTARYDGPRDPITKKRKPVSKGGFKTARDAQRWLNTQLSAKDGGAHVRPSRMTVATFLLGEWLPSVRSQVKPSTWDSFELTVHKYIVPHIGSIELQGLTAGRVRVLYSGLLLSGGKDGRPLSPKTVHNVYAVLHAALADAVALGYVPINVASSKLAPPPSGDRPEMKVWSPAELGSFLDHVAEDRLYAAWLLFATTGMRRGELLGLRWTDVDLDSGRIAIRSNRVRAGNAVVAGTPKTKKGTRRLALDPETIAALRAWRKRQLEERMLIGERYTDSGLVFTYPAGTPILPNRISIWFRGHVRRAGLPTIRLHDVRHSYATAALDAGVPVKVVSERLGHANVQVTMDLYQHVLPEMDETAAATVAALFVRPRPAALAAIDGGA